MRPPLRSLVLMPAAALALAACSSEPESTAADHSAVDAVAIAPDPTQPTPQVAPSTSITDPQVRPAEPAGEPPPVLPPDMPPTNPPDSPLPH